MNKIIQHTPYREHHVTVYEILSTMVISNNLLPLNTHIMITIINGNGGIQNWFIASYNNSGAAGIEKCMDKQPNT